MTGIKVSQVAERTVAGNLMGVWVREVAVPIHQLNKTDPVETLIVPLDVSDEALPEARLRELQSTADQMSLLYVPSIGRSAPEVKVLFNGQPLPKAQFTQAGPDDAARADVRKRAAAFTVQTIVDFPHR